MFLQAGAALGAGLALSDEAWAGIEERAARFGITPGTVVDARGRPREPLDSESYVGEILLVGFNFPMRNFALCQGQLLSIADNDVLFALIGTFYGGNGVTTFALPDLSSRVPMGQGRGTGLSERILSQRFGSESIYLTTPSLPSHTHAISAVAEEGTSRSPSGNVLAGTPDEDSFAPPPATIQMQPTGVTGQNIPIQKVMPSLALNYQICLSGYFPSRS